MELKTIPAPGQNQAFGRLLEPTTNARNDTQLQAAIDANGRAVVAKYKGFTWALEPEPEILTPDQFRTTWQGD